MHQILIKSFNRAFYLDRCLQSIQKFVKGDFKVIVLDDGTPEKYLNKIREKYPEVEIRLSAQYDEKTKAIRENLESGKEIDGFKIPTDLWYNAVKNALDYVLVTEDDVWFTAEIDLDELTQQMKSNQINLLKLGWMGNYNDDKFIEISPISEQINRTIPVKLFTANHFVMDWFMYNKFKFFSILYKLKLFDNEYKRRYWALNSILMGLYQKDYWLHIWKDAQGKVDEKQQLRNAAVWYHRNKKNKNLIARTQKECLQTTFKSSATNSYHKYGFDFDVNYFNYLMNEAWLNDELDSFQNFPKDFSTEYFEEFFDEKINKKEFRKWIEKFQGQYKQVGSNVE